MSASEKLRALLHDAHHSATPMDNDVHGEPLLTVLPQIVEVVEAAERAAKFSDKRGVACQDALVALDEALP